LALVSIVTPRRSAVSIVGLLLVLGGAAAGDTALPNRSDSVKFAVIGDGGTGNREQFEVATRMNEARAGFPFDLVLMVGDNFYGGQRPGDLIRKFDEPYRPLLAAGVVFQAAIGNHDDLSTIDYPPLHMSGQRYYTFARKNVRFVALDTNALDSTQLRWFEATLQGAREEWKVCFFHHPLYSNAGRHGAAVDIRTLLEPILIKYGVDVVFSGHDHVYERLMPQKGIQYFVAGASGQLRSGDMRRSPQTAASYDRDQSFLLVEVAGGELFFEAVSRQGTRVDSGSIVRQRRQP
jgi:hypothetical protein